MFSRVFAAAFAAALGAGALIAPSEATARGGAVSFGHVGGVRSVGVRPFPHVHARFVHARHAIAPAARGAFVRTHEFRAGALRHHRVIFGFGLPLTYAVGGLFYGAYYDPSDVVGSLGDPADADPLAQAAASAAPDPQVPYDRGGCRSQTVTVPSPGGSERSVTITRC